MKASPANARSLSRGARTTRGAVVATLATLLAALSHVAAGGHAPSLAAIVLCSFIALPFVIALTGRRSLLGVTASVLGTQALFHWLFVWINPDASSLTLTQLCHRVFDITAMTRALDTGAALPTALPAALSTAVPLAQLDALVMAAAHVGAAAVTIVMLRHADRAFDAIEDAVAWLARRLTRALTPVAVPARRAPLVCAARPALRPSRVNRAYTLRGPPALCTAR